MSKQKIIAIGGPTSSGKSSLAISIAKQFNGEIINADSRQFYKGMDIGTGKEKILQQNKDGSVNIKGVTHHLIDFLPPDEEFNLYKFQNIVFRKIDKIIRKGKVPILVGGTGLYLDSVIYNYDLSNQPIDQTKRGELKDKSVKDLQKIIMSKNLDIFNRMTESDRKNPHRLIRTIERVDKNLFPQKKDLKYDVLYLCIKIDKTKLKNKIDLRVERMFKEGLVKENENLRKHGFTTKLNSMKAIGYQEFDKYFSKEKTLEETKNIIKLHTRQYAKRQLTWFKRNKNICWISSAKEGIKLISNFL